MTVSVDGSGAITVDSKEDRYQIVTGPNTYGGPIVISIYATSKGEEKTFDKVTDAVNHLKRAGVGSRDISKIRPKLWSRFKAYRGRRRRGKAGPFEGEGETMI